MFLGNLFLQSQPPDSPWHLKNDLCIKTDDSRDNFYPVALFLQSFGRKYDEDVSLVICFTRKNYASCFQIKSSFGQNLTNFSAK